MSNTYGSLDISFDYVPSDDSYIQVISNIEAISKYQVVHTLVPIVLDIVSFEDTTTWIRCRLRFGGSIIDNSDFSMGCPTLSKFKIRVVFGEKCLAVYCNSKIVYQYSFLDIDYPSPVTSSLKVVGDTLEITNIRNVELSDRRDAVYVEYEATSDSAIQSIIQQRPIQVFAGIGRFLQFTYSAIKSQINSHNVSEYQENTKDNAQMSSDAIVYYADVAVVNSEATAREVGFITRLYRLSDLETGAIQAAKTIQEQSLERRQELNVSMRLDPRIERADELLVDLYLTGTGTHLEDDIIVEDTQISISDGQYGLRLSGRRNK